jgi:hypothetical protein
MQLVAYGAQDIYLTGNPMITYFKVVYRRHTNFAMESIMQTFNGTVNWGSRVTALISRNGDLVSGMTLEVILPLTTDRWTEHVGHFLIQQVEVEIGGQLIDRHYADWLEIWSQLTVPADKRTGYNQMIGQFPKDVLGQPQGLQEVGEAATLSVRERKLYIPLQFWFCRNVGLALPLIALQYHEVKVNVLFNTYENIALTVNGAGNPDIVRVNGTLDANLWVDYIYLDTDERRRFAQVSHEYLIEQLQLNSESVEVAANRTASLSLNFNHPVKELVWVYSAAAALTARQPANYTAGQAAPDARVTLTAALPGLVALRSQDMINPGAALVPLASAKLQLNGHDRFASRDADYFNKVQPLAAHTCIPESRGIYVYSFALKPEEHQPSGTCNFSRIDNAKLELTAAAGAPLAGTVKVFATNYNVLRVMSGMGGLAYSN